jgi:nucleoside-diphosphate-sugar epimerase
MLRSSIVFGPDMPNPSLRQLAAMVRRGLFFFIGAPGATANYVHVDNVVAALMLCGTAPRAAGQIYNLSDCRSFEDFIAAIAATCGVPIPTRRLPEPLVRALAATFGWLPRNPLTQARIDAMTGRASYPVDKIAAQLGYGHVVSMEAGIAATLGSHPARPLP